MTTRENLRALQVAAVQLSAEIADSRVQCVELALCLLTALERWSLEEVLFLERGDFLMYDDGVLEVRRPRLALVLDEPTRLVNRLPITDGDGWTQIAAPMVDSIVRLLGVKLGDGDALSEKVLANRIFDAEVKPVVMSSAVCALADVLLPDGADVLRDHHSMQTDLSVDELQEGDDNFSFE